MVWRSTLTNLRRCGSDEALRRFFFPTPLNLLISYVTFLNRFGEREDDNRENENHVCIRL